MPVEWSMCNRGSDIQVNRLIPPLHIGVNLINGLLTDVHEQTIKQEGSIHIYIYIYIYIPDTQTRYKKNLVRATF